MEGEQRGTGKPTLCCNLWVCRSELWRAEGKKLIDLVPQTNRIISALNGNGRKDKSSDRIVELSVCLSRQENRNANLAHDSQTDRSSIDTRHKENGSLTPFAT